MKCQKDGCDEEGKPVDMSKYGYNLTIYMCDEHKQEGIYFVIWFIKSLTRLFEWENILNSLESCYEPKEEKDFIAEHLETVVP